MKRISSTKRRTRPKQGVGKAVPEPVLPKTPEVSVATSVGASVSATPRVVLGTSCTIHEAQALRAQLLAQAELPGPYEIDGSGVQQVDTAGVQLVVAFALDCLERGISYSWKGRSAALDEAIRVLGVGALLESPV